MKPGIEQQVTDWIDERRGTIIEFLKRLVMIPSVTGRNLRSRNSSPKS